MGDSVERLLLRFANICEFFWLQSRKVTDGASVESLNSSVTREIYSAAVE